MDPVNLNDYDYYSHTSSVIDTTPPSTPTISSSTHPENIWSNNDDPVFTWPAVSDMSPITYYYEWDHSSTTNPTSGSPSIAVLSKSYSNQAEGTWYFHVRAKDGAGNWGSTDHYGPVIIDKTAPDIPVISSSTHIENVWSNLNDIDLSWTPVTDVSGVTYYYILDDSSGTNPDSTSSSTTGLSKSYSNQADGTWYFHVRARDGAGNWGSIDHYGSVIIDKTAPDIPVISSTTHAENVWSNLNDIDLSWTPVTDVSGVTYYYILDGSSGTIPSSGSPSTTTTSKSYSNQADGSWYFHVRAKDGAGNWGSTDHFGPVNIYSVGPAPDGIPTESSPDRDFDGNGNYMIYWNPADCPDFVTIALYELQERVNGGPWQTLSSSIATTNYEITGRNIVGNFYEYRIRAQDSLGNVGGWSGSSDGTTIYVEPPGSPSPPFPPKGIYWSHTDVVFDWWFPPSSFYGIGGYSIEITRDSPGGTLVDTAWTTGQYTYPGGLDGVVYYARVAAVDVEGFVGPWGDWSDGITVDALPPRDLEILTTTAFSLMPNLEVTATDDRSGVSEMRFTNDRDTWIDVNYNLDVSYVDNEDSWYMIYKAGAESIKVHFSSISVKELPTGTGIGGGDTIMVVPPATIPDYVKVYGADQTTVYNTWSGGTWIDQWSSVVPGDRLWIRIRGPDGTEDIYTTGSGFKVDKYSWYDDTELSWSDWVPYSDTYQWLLEPNAYGDYGVYFQTRDLVGNAANPVSKTITLNTDDTTPPDVSLLIDDDAIYIGSTNLIPPPVKLDVFAMDNFRGSGVYKYRLSNDGIDWSDWQSWPEPYSNIGSEPDDTIFGSMAYPSVAKVSSTLTDVGGDVIIDILLSDGGDVEGTCQAIEKLDGEIISILDSPFEMVRAEVDAGTIDDIAKMNDVIWMERYSQPRVMNNPASQLLQSGSTTGGRVISDDSWDSIPGRQINGQNQIIAVMDDDLRLTHESFSDADKILGYYVPTGSDGRLFDVNYHSSHGTHTACSVLGDSLGYGDYTVSGDGKDGHAFSAQLIFQDIGDFDASVSPPLMSISPPLDLYNDAFLRAYNEGARIHYNGWGSYSDATSSQQIDKFIWDHPEMIIVFPAGNDNSQITAQGQAKNAITVGGCSVDGGSVWADSGRGPALDGRIKPDILGPYRSKSALATGDINYDYMSGTSMAGAAVAGELALIRQYFEDGWSTTGISNAVNGFEPSAALVKAAAINGAVPVGTIPNMNEGWGVLNVENSLYFSGDTNVVRYIDQTTGLNTGDYVEYTFGVSSGTRPFRVSMVYSDYMVASLEAGLPLLVNDLDLMVTGPSGTFYGNNFAGGFSQTGVYDDNLNNVENVYINNPTTGAYTIRIDAENIPHGPQGFALVVSGGLSDGYGLITLDRAVYDDSDYINIKVEDNNNPASTVSVSITTTNGDFETIIMDTLGFSSGIFADSIKVEYNEVPVPGNGILEVIDGDNIQVKYSDTGPIHDSYAYARIDVNLHLPYSMTIDSWNLGGKDYGSRMVTIQVMDQAGNIAEAYDTIKFIDLGKPRPMTEILEFQEAEVIIEVEGKKWSDLRMLIMEDGKVINGTYISREAGTSGFRSQSIPFKVYTELSLYDSGITSRQRDYDILIEHSGFGEGFTSVKLIFGSGNNSETLYFLFDASKGKVQEKLLSLDDPLKRVLEGNVKLSSHKENIDWAINEVQNLIDNTTNHNVKKKLNLALGELNNAQGDRSLAHLDMAVQRLEMTGYCRNALDTSYISAALVESVRTLVNSTISEIELKVGPANPHITDAWQKYNMGLDYTDGERYSLAISMFRISFKDSLKALRDWSSDSYLNKLQLAIDEVRELQDNDFSDGTLSALQSAEDQLTNALNRAVEGNLEDSIDSVVDAMVYLEGIDEVNTQHVVYILIDGTMEFVQEALKEMEWHVGARNQHVQVSWEKFQSGIDSSISGNYADAAQYFKKAYIEVFKSKDITLSGDLEGNKEFHFQTLPHSTCHWDFGDGTPEVVGEYVNHEYSSPGTYTITLTFRDDNMEVIERVQFEIIVA